MLPSSGPVEGGTRVQLVQGRAYEDAVMGCRFGESHVVAERGPDGAVYCESPYKGTSGVVTFQWPLGEDRLVSEKSCSLNMSVSRLYNGCFPSEAL